MATLPQASPQLSRIAPVRASGEFATLAALFREYQTHINVDLCFQDFESELSHLAQIYCAPRGASLIAFAGEQAIGCVALKYLEPEVCEMKRLYVRPVQQGAGVGRALALAIIARARELGYARMRLDTLASMRAAQALYRALGFVDIAPYDDNPHAQTRFMQLRL